MVGQQEQGVDVYLVRANWPDDEDGGKLRSREVWNCGLFDDEGGVKQKVDELNAAEGKVFGENGAFFYDWCVYTFLSAGDIPY